MNITFDTVRLHLREVLASDLNSIHSLNSTPEIDKYNTLGIPKNIEETIEYVTQYIDAQKINPRIKYVFCIENKEKEFIGLIGLNMGKAHYHQAEIWYKLKVPFWNQGYATEAVKQIISWGFTQLHLHRIEAGCATENIASIKVLEHAGMQREGQHRKLLPIRGEWFDNYSYAILDTDFNSL